jgi:hypothetical protein
VLTRLKDAAGAVKSPLLQKLYLEIVFFAHARQHESFDAVESATVGEADADGAHCQWDITSRNDDTIDTQIISTWSFKVCVSDISICVW